MRRLLTDFRGGDLFGRCRYPLRLEKVPQISQIYTDFYWDVFLVTQISQMTQIFYSSDYTEFIRRFPVEAITHGFSQRRPVRSVQIPTEVGICPTDFTDIHRFLFIGWHGIYSEVSGGDDYSRIFTEATYSVGADTHWEWTKRFNWDSIKNLCISVKSVGQNNPHKEKSVYICEICGTK